MAVVSFDVVTFHARGAWPYRDGEMTHSADGTATLASGEIVSFVVSRYHVPSAPAGERTSYSIALYSAARRELNASKWDAIKAEIRKQFVAHIRRMADGPRPAAIHPAAEAALVAEYAAAAETAGDAWHIANAREHGETLADGGKFDADATRAGIAALASPAAPVALVANTTRACYWRTLAGYVATGPNDRPAPNGGGYARLDALMSLKGESPATIASVGADVREREESAGRAIAMACERGDCAADEIAPMADPLAEIVRLSLAAPALGVVAGRSVDGTEWLTGHGMSGDYRHALVMPWADAVEIAAREERKASATRSPDSGVYGIKARPYRGPSPYTLADYESDEREAAALDALYGDGN